MNWGIFEWLDMWMERVVHGHWDFFCVVQLASFYCYYYFIYLVVVTSIRLETLTESEDFISFQFKSALNWNLSTNNRNDLNGDNNVIMLLERVEKKKSMIN